ncbi:hypothetical protein J2W18_003886 [Rhodococcus cercidiphylli]|nr:hypothetical protein [Rhodococcus cercidiphylli]
MSLDLTVIPARVDSALSDATATTMASTSVGTRRRSMLNERVDDSRTAPSGDDG